jgi:PKD repeat protein
VAWSWDFGDDVGTSTEQNPSYTYADAGTYDVTLTVTDDDDAESEQPASESVEVTEPPLPEGPVFVFVTSEIYEGDFGGLAEADAICQAHATAAQLPGTWTAWLSDDNTDAIERIPEPGPDGKYHLLNPGSDPDRPIVADDLADLTDGSLDLPIDRDEYGKDVNGPWVWTGTQPDGTRTLSNCSNWTNAEAGSSCTEEGDPACGTKGEGDKTDGEWTETVDLRGCSSPNNFYCFSTGQ